MISANTVDEIAAAGQKICERKELANFLNAIPLSPGNDAAKRSAKNALLKGLAEKGKIGLSKRYVWLANTSNTEHT